MTKDWNIKQVEFWKVKKVEKVSVIMETLATVTKSIEIYIKQMGTGGP